MGQYTLRTFWTRNLACLALVLCAVQMSVGQDLRQRTWNATVFAEQQLRRTVTAYRDSLLYPRTTVDGGAWKTGRPGDWTSGFFPGCLWYVYELSGDTTFRSAAERWTAGLEGQKFNTKTHDVGFIMYCSYGNAIRFSPTDANREILLQSARSLSTRFNPRVGCIRSWDNRKWPFPVIIDNMMNLELLFWAAKNGGGKDLYGVAVSHALKTMENHVRADGSTFHVVSYDSSTGAVLARETHQGYADESTWSRGQAWGIYGFTMAYRETNDERFLKTARRMADYFIGRLPADGIPYWDFQAPDIPVTERDVSAAAVAAAGLFELSQYSHDNASYLAAAKTILTSLCAPPYLAQGTPSKGILNHAVGNKPAGSEVDVSLIYADYYFLEALKRYRQLCVSVSLNLNVSERQRVLKAAAAYLAYEPRTVTASSSPRSAGGPHDYFSEGDYWWPDPRNPGGPYVRRDGMTNPDNFDDHRQALRKFSLAVPALVSAYKLTGESRYAVHAVRHLKAWFVDDRTRMNPHLKYAQAVKGVATGRGPGIIDTIHLIEVARAVAVLEASGTLSPSDAAAIKRWFSDYLEWLTTSVNGREERDAKNNHGTCWVVQVAAFAQLVGDSARLDYCRDRFKNVLLPGQMAADGSFPLELSRTKPYGYSLFNLDAMATVCQLLSTPSDNLWQFTLPDGRNMRKAMEFIYPYIVDKSQWPYTPDVMFYEFWPVRQPALLFAGVALNEQKYIDRWSTLEPDPTNEEVIRNLPVRQPVLWFD